MFFRRKFSVPKICCPSSIQATHSHACHNKVAIRFFGGPAFQLPMFANCDALPKRDLFYLFQESMPFGKSKPPLPTRSLRSLRAAVRSTSSALCLRHAHPFVAAEEKRPVSCREAEGLVTELWSPRIVTIY